MPFDSWGAYVYCFEHKSELLKAKSWPSIDLKTCNFAGQVTQNSNSRFEVKLRTWSRMRATLNVCHAEAHHTCSISVSLQAGAGKRKVVGELFQQRRGARNALLETANSHGKHFGPLGQSSPGAQAGGPAASAGRHQRPSGRRLFDISTFRLFGFSARSDVLSSNCRIGGTLNLPKQPTMPWTAHETAWHGTARLDGTAGRL